MVLHILGTELQTLSLTLSIGTKPVSGLLPHRLIGFFATLTCHTVDFVWRRTVVSF